MITREQLQNPHFVRQALAQLHLQHVLGQRDPARLTEYLQGLDTLDLIAKCSNLRAVIDRAQELLDLGYPIEPDWITASKEILVHLDAKLAET